MVECTFLEISVKSLSWEAAITNPWAGIGTGTAPPPSPRVVLFDQFVLLLDQLKSKSSRLDVFCCFSVFFCVRTLLETNSNQVFTFDSFFFFFFLMFLLLLFLDRFKSKF